MDPLTVAKSAIGTLVGTVIDALKTTANFKPQLIQLNQTLQTIMPIIDDVEQLSRVLNRPDDDNKMFIDEMVKANELVQKCKKVKRNPVKRFIYSLKLKDLSDRLLHFFAIEVQADLYRENKRILFEINQVTTRLNALVNASNSLDEGPSSRRGGERHNLGWPVPQLPLGIVTFEEPLKKLKTKVLAGIDARDDDDNDASKVAKMVLVSGAGGCGKTTLVKMLCHDSEILETFGDNIFYVTVSENPAFMTIVNSLFNPNFCQQVQFQSIEDAKVALESFFRDKLSGPILVLLDDVWSESFIKHFQFNIKVRYRVVVTSRMNFQNLDVFKFDPLSDEDAETLFRSSAEPSPTLDVNLVHQMVKCCKKHPLTLAVFGSSLNGQEELVWKLTIDLLSGGGSVLDLNKEVLWRLETSFNALDENLKQCYLDFGLFLEDQRIPAGALLDMWVHLYKHDGEGSDTLRMLYSLSYRNLVSMDTSVGKDVNGTINYCEQRFLTQHDLLRELAINLNSNLPVAQRERLVISEQDGMLNAHVPRQESRVWIEIANKPMQARILSISTGESFSSTWCDIQAPKVEVLVLNLRSKNYTLPPFLKDMRELHVINVTNCGLHPTTLENFDCLGCLSNLTRIRLERVTISLSRSILALQNVQKVSFVMCHIGNAFEELSSDDLDVWPQLVELEMDYCRGLAIFPGILCRSVHIKNLSITNCNEMSRISNQVGALTSLERLSLRSCIHLEELPGSMTGLPNLSVLDISDCLSLDELPEEMGNLGGLRAIYMKGCTGIGELPSSLQNLLHTKVVCDERLYKHWTAFTNVETTMVKEDMLETLRSII